MCGFGAATGGNWCTDVRATWHLIIWILFGYGKLAVIRNHLIIWWVVLGSNQWPLPCEGSALPLS